jgi:hypothetical protein
MVRWFYVALHLLFEAGAARRDARIRLLKAQVEILRRKLGGNRVIPSPDVGMRDEARAANCALQRSHRNSLWRQGRILECAMWAILVDACP